jgi:HTH-type transcriptional regulator/antitoxin HigA
MRVKDLHKANTEYRRVRNLVPLGVLRSAEDYEKAVVVVDEILDKIGEDEDHPLAELAEALSVFIESYEDTYTQLPDVPPKVMLKFLINEHSLNQADLPELGSQGVVSEILSGKRDLNVRQIKILAKRFGVSPAMLL